MNIKSRQLIAHISGIRHYVKDVDLKQKKEDSRDTSLAEFYSKKHYINVNDCLSVFINDKLLFEPG